MAVAGTSNGTATEAPIQSFFCGKSALVTGASGFLGKVLVEKLLRSCHGLDNIYCLIRSKDSESPQQRLEKVLEAPVWNEGIFTCYDYVKENLHSRTYRTFSESVKMTKNWFACGIV